MILFNGDVGTTPAIRKVRGQIRLKVTNSLEVYRIIHVRQKLQTALFPADFLLSVTARPHNRTTLVSVTRVFVSVTRVFISVTRVFVSVTRVFVSNTVGVVQALMFSSTQVSNDSRSLETGNNRSDIILLFGVSLTFKHIYTAAVQ